MSRRPLARDKQFVIGATTVFSGRPQVSGGGGQARDVALEGWDIESMSFAKLRAGQLRVDETLTVGTPGAQRVDIIGSTTDGGIKAYNSGGTLTGQWASQTGALWSVSGGFGGTLAAPSWTLSVSGIIHEDGANSAGMAPADYPFYAGNTFANRASAPFRVTSAGAVTATSGAIGGFDIGDDYIRDAADSFGLASTVTGGDDVRFWAGDSFANRATTADVRIFESGIVHLGSNAATYLVLDGPNVRMRSSDYVSGVTGWHIQADWAEFSNVFIRGALHSTVFVKDLIEAWAGSLVVAKSAGKLNSTMDTPGAGTWVVILEDPPGGGFLFANSDICRVKSEYSAGVADIWFTVSARVDNGNGTQSYTCTYNSGTRSIIYPAGSPAIDYGISGQGYLFMSADLANAPYYDVRTHAGSPWSAETLKVRLGNLAGITDTAFGGALSGYGIYTNNGYFTGTVAISGSNAIKIISSAASNDYISFWNAFTDAHPFARFWGDNTGGVLSVEKVNPSTGAIQSYIWVGTSNVTISEVYTGTVNLLGTGSVISRVAGVGLETDTFTKGKFYPGTGAAYNDIRYIYDAAGGAGSGNGALALQKEAAGVTCDLLIPGFFYPGTGAGALQSTRYLYDAGATSGLAVAGGAFSATGYFYPGTGSALQTAAYIYGGTTLIGINGEIRNTAIIRTTGVAATHLASSGGLEFVTGSLRIRSQGADASTKGGFTFLGVTSDGSADTTFMTITNTGNVTIAGTLTVNGDQTGATDHVFDGYNDLALLHDWRDGKPLPFATGDLLNRDRLLRDSVVGLHARIATLEAEVSSLRAHLN